MLSAIFVDRPRLAIVIALVTTIAGLLSLFVIPLAQYPDIVPPQVQVTTMYPGANSGVVDATVAQAIEAQVVGVDKMIYMKSTSANDGTYNLTVSFAVGTNPDVDTVNVNNRVQTALPQLPPTVQLQGLTVIKRSAAILQFLNLYSDDGKLSQEQATRGSPRGVPPPRRSGAGPASPACERVHRPHTAPPHLRPAGSQRIARTGPALLAHR